MEEEDTPELQKHAKYPGAQLEPSLARDKNKEAYGLAHLTQDKAAKKTVAPFLRTVRKSEKTQEPKIETARFKAVSFLNEKQTGLETNLQAYSTAENINLPGALYETTDMLKAVTHSKGAVLYIVDVAAGEIYQCPRHIQSPRHKVNWAIQEGSTVACHVASTKKVVWCGDVLADPLFPRGVGWSGLASTVKAVICAPILTPENEIVAVIELYRDVHARNYNREDVQLVTTTAAWMGASIYQNQLRLDLLSQQQLNSRLVEFINMYFSDTEVTDVKIISDIMIYAKQMLQAEQTSFYLIDLNSTEVEADCFVLSSDDKQTFKKKGSVKFLKLRSVPAFVARTGLAINVRDVFEDPRFKDTDKDSTEITRTALCSPLMDKKLVSGVILLTNKKDNGYFTAMDETTFQMFATYCSLSLHHYRVRKKIYDKRNYMIINKEVLSHQMLPCEHDVQRIKHAKTKEPTKFSALSWYPLLENYAVMDEYLLLCFQQVLGDKFMRKNNIVRFLLTVKKCCRANPFHNFDSLVVTVHGLSHIINRNKEKFSDLEIQSMMIAGAASYIDHRGKNNSFYYLTNHQLTELYESSPLQNHQIVLLKRLIQDCDMFSEITNEKYKQMLNELEMLMLFSDMEITSRFNFRLKQILNEFNWDNQEHRFLFKGNIMACGRLISCTKVLPYAERCVIFKYMEFLKQNEEMKSYDMIPLNAKSKETWHNVPDDQVIFLETIVIPYFEVLATLLPNLAELLEESRSLYNSWKEVVGYKGKRLWRPEESLVVKTF